MRPSSCLVERPAAGGTAAVLAGAALLALVGWAAAVETPPRTPSRGLAVRLNVGSSRALLIGNQAYRHLTPLETPAADVRALGAVLEKLYGFEVDLLLDADRAQMIDAFDNLVEAMTEDDRLLIYYAGHGHRDEATGEGYWLPVTARPSRRSEWVANNTVRDTLKAVAARHVLVVADSCFAGTLTRQAAVGLPVGVTMDRYYEKLASQKSRTALTSGGLEPVDDAGGGGHSVFAGALLEALRGNPSPILETSKLFAQIKRPVMLGSSGIQQPLYADVRQTGHQDGEFLFFRTSGGPVEAATRPDRPAPLDPSPGGDLPRDDPPSKEDPSPDPPPESAPDKSSAAKTETSGKQRPEPGEVLEVVQTSRRVRSDLWDWEIHLEGPAWALDEVRRVVYHLHPTFDPSQVEIVDRQSRFQLRRTGWGTFEVLITIEYRDGFFEPRQHQLEFN